MNTRNIFTKLSIAMALLALATSGAIWEIRRVRAVTPAQPDRAVGMIGITRGQTGRLNIVDLAIAVDGQLPPDPCRVVLTFRDANGRPPNPRSDSGIRAVRLITVGILRGAIGITAAQIDKRANNLVR